MSRFLYQALDLAGKIDSGAIEALSAADAYRRLRERGLQPSRVAEESENSLLVQPKPSQDRPEILPRLDGKQLLLLTEELAELLEAGLQLEAALRVIEQRQEKSAIKPVAADLRRQVREGAGFSEALRNCGRSFDPLYCNLVAAGEAAGALPRILRRQCEHLEMVGELGRKVISALVYPSIVFISAIVLMFIFLTFLVPQLSVLLSKSGQKLPAITQALISVSLFFGHWWWAVLVTVALGAGGVRAWLGTPSGKARWHRAQLDLPFLGPVLRARFIAEFTQHLSTLSSSGVTILASMELVKGAIGNIYLKGLIEQATGMIREGGSLSAALRKTGFFPPVLLDILGVGEQTGDLAGALSRASKRYDRELLGRIQHLTTLIQPAVILIVALFVGIVAYSMILGILSSVNALHFH